MSMRRFVASLLLVLVFAQPALAAKLLRQSTAVSIKIGPFVDQTDGFTAETGITMVPSNVQLAKNDGAWAAKNDANDCVHEQNGWYECALNTTDTNTLGILTVAVTITATALPVWEQYQVVPVDVYDSLVSGTGTGPRVDVRAWLGTAPATPTTAGVPEVDITHFGGTAGTFASGRPEVNASHIGGTAQSSGGDVGTSSTRFLGMIELDGAVYRYTTNALELAPTGAGGAAETTMQTGEVYKKNATSRILNVFIKDSTTGAGKTGLTSGSAGLTIAYSRPDQLNTDAQTCSPAAMTRGTWVSCGFVEKDATNLPGIYEVGLPNAVIAEGVDVATLGIGGVSGTTPTIIPIGIVDNSLGEIMTRLGVPAGASNAADVAAIKTVVDAIKVKTDPIATAGGLVTARVDGYNTNMTPLQPTVAGRTLDVTATGAAGIDWGNVENPGTTVNLSATTTSAVSGAVGSVTGAVGSVSGAVGSVTGSVGSVAAGGIDASSFAAGAIDSTAIAANAIGASQIADGAIDAGAIAADAITAAKIAANAIAASEIADGALDAATFAGGVLPTNFGAGIISAGGLWTAGATIRKNVAGQGFPVYLVDSNGDPVTGATVTVRVSKDGAASGPIAGSVAEIDATNLSGWYMVSFDAADVNCNVCTYKATSATTVPRPFYFTTAP
jgi:hypothetical protein